MGGRKLLGHMLCKVGRDYLVKLCGTFNLRPVSTLTKDVSVCSWNNAEKFVCTCHRNNYVLHAVDQQYRNIQLAQDLEVQRESVTVAVAGSDDIDQTIRRSDAVSFSAEA